MKQVKIIKIPRNAFREKAFQPKTIYFEKMKIIEKFEVL